MSSALVLTFLASLGNSLHLSLVLSITFTLSSTTIDTILNAEEVVASALQDLVVSKIPVGRAGVSHSANKTSDHDAELDAARLLPKAEVFRDTTNENHKEGEDESLKRVLFLRSMLFALTSRSGTPNMFFTDATIATRKPNYGLLQS